MASARAWRTTATRFAFSFSAISSLVAGIFLTIQDNSLTTGEILSSLGLNLIASVIFAIVFTFFSTERQGKALEENLNDQFSDLSGRLLDRVSDSNKTYLPIRQYSATNGFDRDFNTDLNASLSRTGAYVFRGPSARYVAARLMSSSRQPASVRVSMLDPGNPAALYRRAADRRLWSSSTGKTTEQVRDGMREEILASVVALFDYRHICPVEIAYVADPAAYRLELFDDAVYLSWYHGLASQGMEMPETLKFSQESLLYSLFKMESARMFEVASNLVRFDSLDDDAVLISHVQRLSGRPVSAADISTWRTLYPILVKDFTDFLRGL